MRVTMEWSVRVSGKEKVEALEEFASEVKRGLIDSEMIPADAWIDSASHDWNKLPSVILRWDTFSEMDAGIHEPDEAV
jgi:hypothetical protein